LISVDFPAFGRPTIATLSRAVLVPLVVLVLLVPGHEGQQRLGEVGQALAVLGRDRHRVAEP
jgi:hypothetical protein